MRPFRHLVFATISIVLCSLFYLSCKRIEYRPAVYTSSISYVRAKFFSTISTDPRVTALKNKLFREEQIAPFISEYVKGAGFPRWDKAIVAGGASTTARGEGGGTSYQVIYLPFTRDTTNIIGAILMAVITPRDTLLKTMYRWQYTQLPRKTASSTGATAEQMALFFMGFEHEAFGHTWFRINDTALFHYEYPTARPLRYKADHMTIGRDGISLQLCGWVYVPASGWNEGLEPGQNPQYGNEVYECEDISTGGDGENPFIGDGGGGTGFPGTVGSGSGGSGSGWNDNPCRSIAASGGSNPCDGSGGGAPGWQPQDPVPCDPYIATLQNDTAFASHFSSLTGADTVNRNYETGFFVSSRLQNGYLGVTGDTNSRAITFVGVNLPMNGFLHCHYRGLNSIFSADDVYFMAQIFLVGLTTDSTNLYFGVTSSYGKPYLMKVSNTATFRAFAEKVVALENDNGKFTGKYNPKFATDNANKNEKAFLNMIKDMNGDNGLTLYRGNDACTQWTKLGLNSSTVTEILCF